MEQKITHKLDILEICMNQCGLATQRKIVYLDKNRDLYISSIHKPRPVKIGSMVQSAMWNDKTDILAAIMDSTFTVWLYPAAIFFDRDLINLTKMNKDSK